MKPAPFKREVCPSLDEVSRAVDVLTRQQVSVYQALYAEGLAEPGNRGVFRVRRAVYDETRPTTLISVAPSAEGEEAYAFLTNTPDGVLAKANLILHAIREGREKIHKLACCPLAKPRGCVCFASFNCPLHGQQCHGSHD